MWFTNQLEEQDQAYVSLTSNNQVPLNMKCSGRMQTQAYRRKFIERNNNSRRRQKPLRKKERQIHRGEKARPENEISHRPDA